MAGGTVGDVGSTADEGEIELIDVDLDWHAPAAAVESAPAEPAGAGWRRFLRPDPRWLILVAVVGYLAWLLTATGGDDVAEPVVRIDAEAVEIAQPEP